jgi:hypothetical protein
MTSHKVQRAVRSAAISWDGLDRAVGAEKWSEDLLQWPDAGRLAFVGRASSIDDA